MFLCVCLQPHLELSEKQYCVNFNGKWGKCVEGCVTVGRGRKSFGSKHDNNGKSDLFNPLCEWVAMLAVMLRSFQDVQTLLLTPVNNFSVCVQSPCFFIRVCVCVISTALAWASVTITLSPLFTVKCYISPAGSWQAGTSQSPPPWSIAPPNDSLGCDYETALPDQREKQTTGYLMWNGRKLRAAQQQQCPMNDLDLLVIIQWQFSCWASVCTTSCHWQNDEFLFTKPCWCVWGEFLLCHNEVWKWKH